MSELRKYLRFSIFDRIEHWVQVLSFGSLGLTGLIQKYASAKISIYLIALLGGIETVRIIHRVASLGLMFGTIYHLGRAGYKYYVKRKRIAMLPTMKDVTNAWESFLYNLGYKTQKPQQGRYTFDEKFEYWAFVWGTIIMGLTGFILWNPIFTTKFLPGNFIPAAKAAHSGEALLAVLAIVVWHFYHAHIKHFNKSMFTGYLSEHEMLEEHPLELADIKAGSTGIPQDPKAIARRKRIFFPVYSVAAVVMLAGVYFFVTGEATALETVPPAERIEVFVPYTPTPLPTPFPTPTPAPITGKTWDDSVAVIIENKCITCHGETALGGLNMSTYIGIMSGGASGQVVVPGDAEGSLLIQRQATNDHPGQFTEEELLFISEWIQAGAPMSK